MKISSSREQHFALIEFKIDKVVAVIKCPAGEDVDISDKVKLAINEDLALSSENITTVTLLNVNQRHNEITFDANVIDEDNEVNKHCYVLTLVECY